METETRPAWSVTWDPTRTHLRLTVSGHLDEATGKAAAAEFLNNGRLGPFEFVADLAGMTGYDRSVREAFQAAFAELRSQMSVIHFIGLGPVYRMAAATVCLAAGLKAQFHADEQSVPLPPRRSA